MTVGQTLNQDNTGLQLVCLDIAGNPCCNCYAYGTPCLNCEDQNTGLVYMSYQEYMVRGADPHYYTYEEFLANGGGTPDLQDPEPLVPILIELPDTSHGG